MNPRKKWLALLIALVATIAVGFLSSALSSTTASAATGTYGGNVLPNGIGSTPSAVTSNAQMLVSNDYGVQAILARDNHLGSAQIASAKVVRVTKTSCVVRVNCDNTVRLSNGSITTTSYDHGQSVAAWNVTLKISATKTVVVTFKQSCANPLLHMAAITPPMIIVSKTASFVMTFAKSVTTVRTITCPSGQAIGIHVVTSLKGSIRVTSVTQGVTIISTRLTAAVNAVVKTKISTNCGPAPKPAPVVVTPAPQPAPTIQCATGYNLVGGNCVQQTNTAVVSQSCSANQVWNGAQCISIVTQTNITIVANCSNVNVVVGSGIVYEDQNGNICSVTTTTPPVTPPTPPVTPPAPSAPSVVNFTTINDVDAGAISPNFCATVSVAGSDSGTLFFSALYGSFSTGIFSVNGVMQQCVTYTAPADASTTSDTVTVKVIDNVTGLSDQKVQTFPINAVVTHP